MAGHSHYKNMVRHKNVVDAKRGKLFSKLSRYIIIAARNGGGDPTMNLKLRYAIDKARVRVDAQGQHRAGHQARHRRARRRSTTTRSSTRATAPAASPSWSRS